MTLCAALGYHVAKTAGGCSCGALRSSLEGVHVVAMPDAKPSLLGWATVMPGGRFDSGRGALRGVTP